MAASAGGVEALTAVLATLPAETPAVILVVLHVAPVVPSVFPAIIARHSQLPARHPDDGELLTAGTVYVAPPDHHLLVSADGRAVVQQGPRENGHRPAADPLFRSVAAVYGRRAVGVVLSGALDDGAAGLAAIKQAGGFAVVQDPDEAAFPSMPRAAIAVAHPDRVASVHDIGAVLLDHLTTLDAGRSERGASTVSDLDPPSDPEGAVSEMTCPDCGGTLWCREDHRALGFECRIGHRYGTDSLMVGKRDALEKALWAAIVALEERADLSRRLLRRLGTGPSDSRLARRYEHQISESDDRLETLRTLVAELIEPVDGFVGDHHGDDQEVAYDRGR